MCTDSELSKPVRRACAQLPSAAHGLQLCVWKHLRGDSSRRGHIHKLPVHRAGQGGARRGACRIPTSTVVRLCGINTASTAQGAMRNSVRNVSSFLSYVCFTTCSAAAGPGPVTGRVQVVGAHPGAPKTAASPGGLPLLRLLLYCYAGPDIFAFGRRVQARSLSMCMRWN